MKQWFEISMYVIGMLAIVALIVWYFSHIWSDCLDENSFLTCLRMLS
jgi:Na+/H+ antiporter NhaC